jgi:uncharacterized membrane protein YjjB (DUF3815 family)
VIDLPDGFLPYVIALIGAACFAVTYRVPHRYLLPTILVGSVASIAIKSWPSAWHVGFSTFMTALLIGVLAHIFARHTSAPAQTFLIPGVIFLVPGTTIYRAFSKALESDVTQATELLLAAVTIASGISFGILIANWIVPSRKTL